MYKLYSKHYEIMFDSDNYLKVSILENFSNRYNLGGKWVIYLNSMPTNISKLLQNYTNQKTLSFKSKKELENLLYNFCNYYNLNYPKIILKEIIWLYNNKIFLLKNELNTDNQWKVILNIDIIKYYLQSKKIHYKAINKMIIPIIQLNILGFTRKEALNNLDKVIKEKYVNLEISQHISLEEFLELYNL